MDRHNLLIPCLSGFTGVWVLRIQGWEWHRVCGLATPLAAVGDEEVVRERKQQLRAAAELVLFLSGLF